jgi:hypothetical protein
VEGNVGKILTVLNMLTAIQFQDKKYGGVEV